MKIIKYFSKDIIDWENKKIKDDYTGEIREEKEAVYDIVAKEYKTNDKEFNYWLDIIEKTYGRYGKVAIEDIQDELTQEEIVSKVLNSVIIDNKKKDLLIECLAREINSINIKMKGE
ncbi:hypothetical protein [Clostridium rectalis]|uniref:hypothetical protein n=1 Tax=Clostridium rectalis TaxID=2040295 RepID=UPI000F63E5B3|nr:hypothetical protein [Clostridium rectalis]